MLRLIHVENIKIYAQRRTQIILVLILAAILIMGFAIRSTVKPEANWKQELQQQNEQIQKELNNPESTMPEKVRSAFQLEMAKNQYLIDHDISPNEVTGWKFANTASNLMPLITVFAIMVAGDSIAGEFSSGTINLLLIRPVRRIKILLAKYVSTLLFALILLVALGVFSLLVGGLFFGFSGTLQPYVYTDASNQVRQMPMISKVLLTYGFKGIELWMMVTFSFMISSLFRSSGLAIGVSLLLAVVGSTIARALSSYSWDKYLLFANTDLSQYIEGQPIVEGTTMTFSGIVLLAYFVLFLFVTWLSFVKRDVHA
ncbi:MAG: ABC transporter permease [Alicyclobacillaceae bacterium]|nr:ABC transporter permease [Alicyclobacillaceae bacterium]